MPRLIFLLICLTNITHHSCHESNININNNDKQESCSKNVDDDSLCEDQVCRKKKELLLPSIVRIFNGGTW